PVRRGVSARHDYRARVRAVHGSDPGESAGDREARGGELLRTLDPVRRGRGRGFAIAGRGMVSAAFGRDRDLGASRDLGGGDYSGGDCVCPARVSRSDVTGRATAEVLLRLGGPDNLLSLMPKAWEGLRSLRAVGGLGFALSVQYE